MAKKARGAGSARRTSKRGHGIASATSPSGISASSAVPVGSEVSDGGEDAFHDINGIWTTAAARSTRGGDFDMQVLAELRRHVVNLTAGKYSKRGFTTSAEDVAAIFQNHLPAWENQLPASEPLQIVLYAHGGLTSEKNGLLNALKHLDWWKANGVYPIFFVWETGFFESISQLLGGSTRQAREVAAARDWTDITDRAWEAVARRLGGELIWSGMKRSAQLSFAPGGGGRDFSARLAEFCAARPNAVELHAACHSAGSIFLSHGLPYMLKQGVPNFRSLHLLAPAVRVDQFRRQLADRIGPGKGVDHVTLYTMHRRAELDDSVGKFGPYGKSLLYLIHYALEDQRGVPIVGLQASIAEDAALARLFGAAGFPPSNSGDAVWSPTAAGSGRNASRVTTHGDFDDDPATLNSVVRRVRGLSDDDPIVPYTQRDARSIAAVAAATAAWFEDEEQFTDIDLGENRMASRTYGYPYYSATSSRGAGGSTQPAEIGGSASRGGAKRALCVGINAYPEAPLAGCVSDARRWAEWFTGRGFTVQSLEDGQATRQGILDAIGSLLRASRAGDVIAIQYSGHGTQVPDLDGDEQQGDTPGFDEALVPVDHRRNGYVIDDDLAALCREIPNGVNVTFFMDCCHSGTNTRMLLGAVAPPSDDARARFLPADLEMIETHQRTRRAMRSAAGPRNVRDADASQAEVAFAACRSDQVAWESNGQGDFTRHAIGVLGRSADLTHDEFLRNVESSFGWRRRQQPELHCDEARLGQRLLSPIAAAPTPPPSTPDPNLGDDTKVDAIGLAEFVALLKQLLHRLRT